MKITKKYLQRIIAVELRNTLKEGLPAGARPIKTHEAFIAGFDKLFADGVLMLKRGEITGEGDIQADLKIRGLFDQCTHAVLMKVKRHHCAGAPAMTLKGAPQTTAIFDSNLCYALDQSIEEAAEDHAAQQTPQEVELDYGP